MRDISAGRKQWGSKLQAGALGGESKDNKCKIIRLVIKYVS
jgi:hypothetical protein